MNRERLTHMIGILKNVQAAALPFSLDDWAEPPGRHACGTTACACGYAGLDPEFQKQGFFLELNGKRPKSIAAFNTAMRREPEDVTMIFGDNDSWRAVSAFFKIGESSAERLFQRAQYKRSASEDVALVEDEALVINRIEKLLELGETKFASAYDRREVL